jgi:putative restriction endonuclease
VAGAGGQQPALAGVQHGPRGGGVGAVPDAGHQLAAAAQQGGEALDPLGVDLAALVRGQLEVLERDPLQPAGQRRGRAGADVEQGGGGRGRVGHRGSPLVDAARRRRSSFGVSARPDGRAGCLGGPAPWHALERRGAEAVPAPASDLGAAASPGADGSGLAAVARRQQDAPAMRGLVAPTDHGWYQFLLARPELTEVNFWRPGGTGFAALKPGEPWFFKLKAPHHAIGGFGRFARFARLPVWRAWDLFGPANGTADEFELIRRLGRLSSGSRLGVTLDRPIGCAAIADPVFFAPDEWVTAPADWAREIVSGRGYDLTRGEGRRIWQDCLERAAARRTAADWTRDPLQRERTGAPQLILPRLGTASFRLAVLDAYGHQCAITTEHSLPVLDAATSARGRPAATMHCRTGYRCAATYTGSSTSAT